MDNIFQPLKEVLKKYLDLFSSVYRGIRVRKYFWLAAVGVIIFIGGFLYIWGYMANLSNEAFTYDIREEGLIVPEISRTIADGVKNKKVYVDAFYTTEPSDLITLRNLGMKIYVSTGNIARKQDLLFRCGLLLLNYDAMRNDLSNQDLIALKTYFANGGRALLLCPTWAWVGCDKKKLERLPHYKIAKLFDLNLMADNVATPLKLTPSPFYISGLDLNKLGSLAIFSSIGYEDALPIMVGRDGKAAAVAARRGKARMIVWGHNSLGLMDSVVFQNPAGKEFIRRIFTWLISD